jgi:hypothetical protein
MGRVREVSALAKWLQDGDSGVREADAKTSKRAKNRTPSTFLRAGVRSTELIGRSQGYLTTHGRMADNAHESKYHLSRTRGHTSSRRQIF